VGGLRKPDVPAGPLRDLFEALHGLHHRAGWPSLRTIAKEVGCSHTTVSSAFAGPAPPRWGLLELIVETLQGEVTEFHRLWLATGPEGTTEPAPAQVTSIVPHQLPADVSAFTGRADQLDALDRVLQSTELNICAVSGTAGVGKTTLAVHWSHRVADRFPDGQLYLNLRGYDPQRPVGVSEALETLLRALLPDGAAIPHDQAERAGRWRTLLAGRRMLILLDNAHSTVQVRDLLPGSGRSLVLITSRDSLAGLVARHGAVRIDVDLLAQTEAVALLRTLLGERVDAEPQAAVRLAELCVRLPLALRIAAEMIMARPRMTLAQLAAELADGAKRLDLLAAGDDEYTAVRAVFSWSCCRLSDEEDRAFRLLGLAPCRRVDAAAMAALLGTTPAEARRVLDCLRRAHLVAEETESRFGMHDLLRSYASERVTELEETERQAAIERLGDYYLRAATGAVAAAFPGTAKGEQPSQTPEGARAWLDQERANLLAMVATDRRHVRTLSRVLASYLDTCAHYADGLVLHGAALAAARSAGDRAAEAVAANLLGAVHRRLSNYSQARENYVTALELHRANGDRPGQAQAHHGLGIVCWRLGQYAQARDHLLTALTLAEELGDQATQGSVLYGLGTVHFQLGEYRDAVAYSRRALDIHRNTGDRLGESRSLNNLGVALERLGNLDEACELYRSSLSLNQRSGNHIGVAVALTNLGSACTKLGRDDDALTHHLAAMAIYRDTGYRVGETDGLCGLGLLYLRLGRHDQAAQSFRLALEIATEVGQVEVQTAALAGLGDAMRLLGNLDEAGIHYAEALSRATLTGDRYGRALTLDGLARLHHGKDDDAAEEIARQAVTLYAELGLAIPEDLADIGHVSPIPERASAGR
jgi:tetratricopeptide (TPR) repeat protein